MPTDETTAATDRRYATAAQKWRAIQKRDPLADGRFFYGVRSTGIYCRPHCGSRQPRRDNVEFFAAAQNAQAAGYRPCKRCRPNAPAAIHPAVDAARAYIETHAGERITLAALSRRVHLSPYHLQRIFKAALGITPHQYQAALRMRGFKARLRAGGNVTASIYGAGYGSGSRLYEQTAARLGMKPTAYRSGGAGTVIDYTVIDTDLGRVLIAATATGLCRLTLGDDAATLERELRAEFPAAKIAANAKRLKDFSTPVRNYISKRQPLPALPLDLQGTVFQQKVWQALRAIPHGHTRSYGEVAAAIGMPKAARAVASACADNPVALVVPCHRVIGKDGKLAGYRWGKKRKKALLEREAASPGSKKTPH